MGLSRHSQDLFLNWLRGVAFPAPPSSFWLSLHDGLVAGPNNAIGGRMEVEPSDLGSPRSADLSELPHDPWMPSPGDLRELSTVKGINTGLFEQNSRLLSWALWDAQTGGNLILRGVLQSYLDVEPGDVVAFNRGDIVFRVTSVP
jgi:hypothetical protein